MAEKQPKKAHTSGKQYVIKGSKPNRPSGSTGNKTAVTEGTKSRTIVSDRPSSSTVYKTAVIEGTKSRDTVSRRPPSSSSKATVTEENSRNAPPAYGKSKTVNKSHDVVDHADEKSLESSGLNKNAKITKTKSTPESMPIHMVNYQGTKYDLTKALSKDSQIVIDRAKSVEENLKLAKLGRDLSSLGKFVHLACCGVVGHTELQIKTRKVLINVGDITEATYCTLRDFESTSKSALKTMKIGYGYLKNNLEAEAYKIFNQMQKKFEEMRKISESLSKKCMDESTNVNNLGNETLEKKAATEADKEETDRLAKLSTVEKEYEEKALEESKKEEVTEKKKEAPVALDNEKKVFEEKKLLADKTEKKLQCEHQNNQKDKEDLKSTYDANDGKITNEIKESQLKFEKALLSNKESYEQSLAKLITTLREKIKSAKDTYEKQITQSEKEFQEKKRKNDRLFEQEIKEHKENYDKKVSDAEEKYQFTSETIEKEYRDAIQASDDKLSNKLTQATQKLEAELEANKHKYGANVDACWTDKGKAKDHEEWSKIDEAKRINSDRENSARSDNIRAHRMVQETRDDKLKTAFEEKWSKIAQAEMDKKKYIEDTLKNNEKLNNTAAEKKRDADAIAKFNKEKAISDAKEEKEADELKAKEKKANDDKSSTKIKTKEDATNESERKHLYQQYKERLQQKEKDLESIEKQINEEYQKKISIIDQNFQYLKEKSAEVKSGIKNRK